LTKDLRFTNQNPERIKKEKTEQLTIWEID
jgi:hypothetical protein